MSAHDRARFDSAPGEYTVAAGDNLSKIAARNGMTLARLLAAVNILMHVKIMFVYRKFSCMISFNAGYFSNISARKSVS